MELAHFANGKPWLFHIFLSPGVPHPTWRLSGGYRGAAL